MKEIQESQAFVALAGVMDPKIPVGDDRYHDDSCQRSLLSFLLQTLCVLT